MSTTPAPTTTPGPTTTPHPSSYEVIGTAYYLDELGDLYLATTYRDEFGETWTDYELIESGLPVPPEGVVPTASLLTSQYIGNIDAAMSGVTLQVKRASAATWSSENPILLEGEIGINLDTMKFKIGNGTSNWSAINYFKTTEYPEGFVAVSDTDTLTAGGINYSLGDLATDLSWPDPSLSETGTKIKFVNKSDEGTDVYISPTHGSELITKNWGVGGTESLSGSFDTVTAINTGSTWEIEDQVVAKPAAGGSSSPRLVVSLAYGVAIPTTAGDPVAATLQAAGEAYYKDTEFLGDVTINGVAPLDLETGDFVFTPDSATNYLCRIIGNLYSSTSGATGVQLIPSSGIACTATAVMNGTDDCPITGGRILRGSDGAFTLKSLQPPSSGASASISYGFIIEFVQLG